MSTHRTIALTSKGEAAVAAIRRPRSGQITLADLATRFDTYHGRTITVRDHTGRLDAVTPLGTHIQLVLNVGGTVLYTDALPVGEGVQVHAKEHTP